MNKPVETLEDLLCYLECASDSLFALHCLMEDNPLSERVTANTLFAIVNHLEFIAKAMDKHIRHIPSDVLRKAGEEVAK